MELASVRALKAELYEPFRAHAGLLPQEAPDISVPAERATDIPRVLASIALGIAPAGGSDFRLAVRVQHRDLLRSSRLDAIHKAARGEVDVRYIGRVARQANGLTARSRPVRPGISIGHHAITAGTLGALVRLAGHDRPRLLSNNHVLADENRGAEGDEIVQPGVLDGGTLPIDRVGVLERFVALDGSTVNIVDAAIASLDSEITFDPTLEGIGHVQGTVAAEDVANVTKLGRTTGLTHGSVSAIEVDNVVVEFSTGSLRFDGQIEISGTAAGPLSLGGDSGSLIVTAEDPRAVGLLFAGSDQGGPEGYGVTYANPIASVFDQLAISSLW